MNEWELFKKWMKEEFEIEPDEVTPFQMVQLEDSLSFRLYVLRYRIKQPFIIFVEPLVLKLSLWINAFRLWQLRRRLKAAEKEPDEILRKASIWFISGQIEEVKERRKELLS